MPHDHFEVGVVIARRKVGGPWGGDDWLPYAVLPAVPAAACGAPLPAEGDAQLYYGGCGEVALHATETAHYRDNLVSGRPSLWVALERVSGEVCRVASVTADPYEGEALVGAMDLIVEPIQMPPEIIERIAAFVAAFHVERPFVKRRRDPVNPIAAPLSQPVIRSGGEQE